MIKHLTHTNIDKKKWDDCVMHSINKIIYAFSWYLDIVSPNWEALIEDDYTTVFPLTWRKKTGISYLCQPSFTQQLGIFSTSIIDEKKVQIFFNHIPSQFKVIEICLNASNPLSSADISITKRLNHELYLGHNYDNLYKHFSTNTKRNIKKAVLSGITIRNNSCLHDIIKIFCDNKGKEMKCFDNNDYNTLEKIIQACKKKSTAEVIGAYTNDGRLCGGAVFVEGCGKYIFLFSATNKESKKYAGMSLLIDRFIHQHATEQFVLDFEGSDDKNLARFYKSFGSEEKYYFQIKQNKLSPLLKQGMRVFKKLTHL